MFDKLRIKVNFEVHKLKNNKQMKTKEFWTNFWGERRFGGARVGEQNHFILFQRKIKKSKWFCEFRGNLQNSSNPKQK